MSIEKGKAAGTGPCGLHGLDFITPAYAGICATYSMIATSANMRQNVIKVVTYLITVNSGIYSTMFGCRSASQLKLQ